MDAKKQAAELCSAFVRGLLDVLEDNLHGVYVYGAIAFPETTHTGDIDFHVILEGPLGDEEVAAVNDLHTTLANDFPPLGGELDGYYILLENTRSLAPPTHQLRKEIVDGSWALHCAHIRAGRCIVLHGPDPKLVYPEPTWSEIERDLRGELAYVEDHLAQYPDYCILNLCRLIYSFVTRDVVVSKTASAAWAFEAFPEWRRLIETAMLSYAGRTTAEDQEVMRSEVGDLLRFAQGRIAASQGKRTTTDTRQTGG